MMRLTLSISIAVLCAAFAPGVQAAGFDNLGPKAAPKRAAAPVPPQVENAPRPSTSSASPSSTPASASTPAEPTASSSQSLSTSPSSGPTPTSTTGPATRGEPRPTAKPAPAPRGAVAIQSDGGFEYNGDTGMVIYRKNVLVEDPANDPRTTISCDWLTTILPPPGGKIGEIIALTNVVITIKDAKGVQVAKGAKAVYNATNDTVIITGNPIVEMPSGILLGDERVIYTRATEKFEAPGRIRMIARPGADAAVESLLRGTNAPKSAASTNTVNPKPTKP